MIRVRGLTKRFGAITAVRNLSFDAPNGTITGLLGANGAGKTTVLRMMSGVLCPDAGSIQVDQVDAGHHAAAIQQRLGALLDHTGLSARLTAREHLAYFGRLHHMTSPALESGVQRMLSALGLSVIADRRTAGFSQGERMKVALGRAMIHAPSHLVLDEPTNGLDVPTVRMVRMLLRQLRDEGTCILFSSHVLGEVEELCDRIIVIARGTLVAAGTRDELCVSSGSRTLEEAFVRWTSQPGELAC